MSEDIFVNYPQKLRANSAPDSPVYTRLAGYYAVHGWRANATAVKPIQMFDEEDIALLQGEPEPADDAASSTKLSPVYTLASGGAGSIAPGDAARSMAVPTGRVFIRFADGVNISDHETEIGNAGYQLEQKLAYAPNAAWLRAGSSSIADALNGIDALQQITGVENVEPQMLMHASYR